MKQTCDMCLSVIEKVDDTISIGTYCDFCYQDGKLVYEEDDVHAFRQRYFEKMHAEGSNEFVARFHTLLIGFAPYWKQRRY